MNFGTVAICVVFCSLSELTDFEFGYIFALPYDVLPFQFGVSYQKKKCKIMISSKLAQYHKPARLVEEEHVLGDGQE